MLAAARNRVLVADAEARGIKVTDEDVAEFARQQVGSSDFSSIATSYGMSEESVVSLLRESCVMNKLQGTWLMLIRV